MKTLIGCDFSINKPAVCIYYNGSYQFIGWPYDPKEKLPGLYKGTGVTISSRTDDKEKGKGISDKVRYEVKNARYLADVIFTGILPYTTAFETYIAFEGLSYASSGDSVLQLGGYKYMLMDSLFRIMKPDNMFTYSPITVKSTAGCAKKGMGKSEMIEAFIRSGVNSKFREVLELERDRFRKKGDKSWIDFVDDLADSFWILQTLREKENL